ncbi:MAG: NAD(+) diphosphatase [Synergistaceae bacterium]|nr:NAD(+) diphosphatase [Synergistaceae bacterium]
MLVFCKDKILVNGNNYNFSDEYINSHSGIEIINDSRKFPAMWQSITAWIDSSEINLYPDEKLINLRELYHLGGFEAFTCAAGAWEFANWFRNVKICSFCGEKLSPSANDFGRVCPSCKRVFYAPQSPAVIVAVERENKLLLAHNKAWPSDRVSIIAGFVEPGESLENAVTREIREEVGIEVKHIKYFGSQTWPFPNSLMLGFTAEYESGNLHPDGAEIESAGFYTREEINNMNIPDKASIARKLIDNFIATH